MNTHTGDAAGRRARTRALLAALLALALTLAVACSSNDDDATKTTSPPADATSESTATTAASDTTTAEPLATFTVPADHLARIADAGFDYQPTTFPPQPDDVPYPTDEWPTGDLPEGVDADTIQAIIDGAFAPIPAGEPNDSENGGDTIHAILAVQGGRLVVEEYNDWDPAAPHNSWSMAKSITQVLTGILVGEDRLDIWGPAPVPEWSDPADPRHAITLDMLLRMSSGLEWSESYTEVGGDVLNILVGDGQADRAGYTAAKPLESDPDTVWEYSTGTPDIVARAIGDEVGLGDDYVQWVDDALFAPLGITSVDHAVDDAGVIDGGSWINLSAQDFARIGLLYLRNGVWENGPIVPDGWVEYARMPTPTADGPFYGALWWLDDDVRPGMFHASGFDGQSITVVPDLDLVVVVLSKAPQGRDEAVRLAMVDAFAGAVTATE